MISIELTLKQAVQTKGCIKYFVDMLKTIDGDKEAHELMVIHEKIDEAILNE